MAKLKKSTSKPKTVAKPKAPVTTETMALTVPETVTAPVVAEGQSRQELLKLMPPALQKVALFFDKGEQVSATNNALMAYDRGVTVKAICDCTDTTKYGADPLDYLERYTGNSVQTLCFLRDIANVFSRDEVLAITKRLTSSGKAIGYSHLRLLAQFDHPVERKKLTERCFAESLTYVEIEELVMQRNQERRPDGRKAAASLPRSPVAALQQAGRLGDKVEEQCNRWLKVAVGPLEEAEPSRFTPLVTQKIDEAVVSFDESIQHLQSTKLRLSALSQRAHEAVSVVAAATATAKVESEKLEDPNPPTPAE